MKNPKQLKNIMKIKTDQNFEADLKFLTRVKDHNTLTSSENKLTIDLQCDITVIMVTLLAKERNWQL